MANRFSEYGKQGAVARWGKRTTEERFWMHVDIRSGPLCWLWKKPSKNRYPMFQRHTKQAELANRVAYELTYGTIPKGKIVRHCCDNTQCVNPNHLLLGTHADNGADKRLRSRYSFPKDRIFPRGPDSAVFRHSDELVKQVKEMHLRYERTARDIARELKLSYVLVRYLLYVRH